MTPTNQTIHSIEQAINHMHDQPIQNVYQISCLNDAIIFSYPTVTLKVHIKRIKSSIRSTHKKKEEDPRLEEEKQVECTIEPQCNEVYVMLIDTMELEHSDVLYLTGEYSHIQQAKNIDTFL